MTADPDPTDAAPAAEPETPPEKLGTYARKKIMSTDLKMGGQSKQLTEFLHLDPVLYPPGSVQVVVSLAYAHGFNMIDQDDGSTLHCDQTLDPRIAMVLPEGSLRTELIGLLDDSAAQIRAAADGDGQQTFTPRVVGSE